MTSVSITEHLGCFKDTRDRALPHGFRSNNKMTVQFCTKHCKSEGYRFAGVQYAQECWCGNFGFDRHGKANNKDCHKPCKGNKKQKCGGDWRQNVYDLGKIESILYCLPISEIRKKVYHKLLNFKLLNMHTATRDMYYSHCDKPWHIPKKHYDSEIAYP